MGLFDFIDTTFILTLGIVLLICGGIMIYCYRRLNILENGLIQQGRVMQEFITNYNLNNEMFMQNKPTLSENKCPVDNLQNITNEKIMVSDDDSDSDSDDDDDLESDNDSNSESDDNNDGDNDNLVGQVKIDKENLESVIRNLSDNDSDSDSDNETNNVKIENMDNSTSKELDLNILNDTSNNSLDDDINLDIKELVLEDLNNLDLSDLSNSDSKRIIPISDLDGQDISKKNPNKLKVDELRELVVNKNLISNEDAQKLKKTGAKM